MVKEIENITKMPWQLWLALILFSGGGTFGANMLTGNNGDREYDTMQQTLDDLVLEVRDMRQQLQASNYEAWTYRMERDVWEDANKELRKVNPAWVGPDIRAAKQNNNNGGKL